MSGSGGDVDTAAAPGPVVEPGRNDFGDLRFAGILAAALAVLGVVLGLVWSAWSPPGPRAVVLGHGQFIPDETEAFIAGDGRFLVIAAVVGVVAGLAVWRVVSRRGPLVALALAAGGLAGSALMELIGHLTGGGSTAGKRGTLIASLPLSLHSQGLLFAEPALAALTYGILVAFTAHDDLGRPDPLRTALRSRHRIMPVGGPWDDGSEPATRPSVEAVDDAQDGRGHSDAAGALQQRDLPPQ